MYMDVCLVLISVRIASTEVNSKLEQINYINRVGYTTYITHELHEKSTCCWRLRFRELNYRNYAVFAEGCQLCRCLMKII